MKRTATKWALPAALLLTVGTGAWALERFPPPDFETAYEMPELTVPAAPGAAGDVLAAVLLLVALSLAAWFVHRLRSRRAVAWLSVFSLVYFGFIRKGCVCPVGSLQHVALSLADGSYVLPVTVALFFALPLLFALVFGRVFCGGVCPLGVIQDVVLVKPVRVPEWLEHALGLLPFVYLGLAVLLVMTGTGFVICRFDPFVALFRRSGELHMLVAGGIFLAVSAFIGRPYCRFLCPYGVLLGLFSRAAWRKVSTTPDECIVCSLCENACPFGAITKPTPEAVVEEE